MNIEDKHDSIGCVIMRTIVEIGSPTATNDRDSLHVTTTAISLSIAKPIKVSQEQPAVPCYIPWTYERREFKRIRAVVFFNSSLVLIETVSI